MKKQLEYIAFCKNAVSQIQFVERNVFKKWKRFCRHLPFFVICNIQTDILYKKGKK